jgi:DNA-binding ferritin-like protein
MKSTKEIKERIIAAGYDAVEQLIKVAKEDIIKPNADDELAADKLKNAAATKKLAIFDAFEILSRIESEKDNLDTTNSGPNKIDSIQGFAERRSK